MSKIIEMEFLEWTDAGKDIKVKKEEVHGNLAPKFDKGTKGIAKSVAATEKRPSKNNGAHGP